MQLLGNSSYPFTVADVIQSSYASFVTRGFNYTAPVATNIQQVLSMTADDIQNGDLWSMSGTFNLLICDLSATWSMDEFYSNINYEGYGYVAR